MEEKYYVAAIIIYICHCVVISLVVGSLSAMWVEFLVSLAMKCGFVIDIGIITPLLRVINLPASFLVMINNHERIMYMVCNMLLINNSELIV